MNMNMILIIKFLVISLYMIFLGMAILENLFFKD